MSIAEGPLRKPSLADTFADIDRRIKTVEFGDPNAVGDARTRIAAITDTITAINNQITILDQAIAQLSGQLGDVHTSANTRDQILYVNDGNIYTWLTAYAPPLRTWQAGALANWVAQRVDWAILWHQYAFHGQAQPAPSSPGFPAPPTIPAWPIITDPNP
jgi:hypothetical protein